MITHDTIALIFICLVFVFFMISLVIQSKQNSSTIVLSGEAKSRIKELMKYTKSESESDYIRMALTLSELVIESESHDHPLSLMVDGEVETIVVRKKFKPLKIIK